MWRDHLAEAPSLEWEFALTDLDLTSRGTSVFTDGSNINDEVGAGIAVYQS